MLNFQIFFQSLCSDPDDEKNEQLSELEHTKLNIETIITNEINEVLKKKCVENKGLNSSVEKEKLNNIKKNLLKKYNLKIEDRISLLKLL